MTLAVILILAGCVIAGIAIGYVVGYCHGLGFARGQILEVMRDTEETMRSLTRTMEQRNEDAEWRGYNRGN